MSEIVFEIIGEFNEPGHSLLKIKYKHPIHTQGVELEYTWLSDDVSKILRSQVNPVSELFNKGIGYTPLPVKGRLILEPSEEGVTLFLFECYSSFGPLPVPTELITPSGIDECIIFLQQASSTQV